MPNTTAAIMALPAPLEQIRLVGDEEKHATLLFFGETSTLPDDAKDTLTNAVSLASSMLFPFSERVRDVSRLGPDTPPALVAMLSNENLTQVRNLFMMNPSIKSYLDNTAQFPQFTPHITLGYPDYTDEVIIRSLMQSIYRVQFDRLAVWWNDERLEFPLTSFSDSESMAMSDAIGNFLEHHGIKGQKWGVRKDQVGISAIVPGSHKGEKTTAFVGQRSTSKNPEIPSDADVKNLSKITFQARDGALSKSTLAGIESLNKSVMSDIDSGKYQWNKAAQSKYEELVAAHMEAGAKAAIKNKEVTAWVNPQGNNEFMLHVGHKDAIAQFKKDAAELGHASIGNVSSLKINTKRDKKGLVIGFDVKDSPASHDDLVDDFLEHHGIKGMKWGVRRSRDSSTGLVARTGSEDQIRQDRIAKKIASGGAHSLSNRDIQDFTRRLQLQSDLDRALAAQSSQTKAKADGFIKTFVKKQGSRQFNRVADKAIDIAVEKALEEAGLKLGKKGVNPDLADTLVKVSTRLQPKKKK